VPEPRPTAVETVPGLEKPVMSIGRRTLRALPLLTLLTLPLWGCAAADDPDLEEEALFREFEETMSGATLAGYFTTGNGELSEERYTIQSVSRVQGETWLFQARIQYGERDVTVPLPLQVKWAGDTPVITLTDLSLPGLGTFTARVLVYRDHYAGAWWAGEEAGGQLFGRIEKR
jgi:hypothetical protein